MIANRGGMTDGNVMERLPLVAVGLLKEVAAPAVSLAIDVSDDEVVEAFIPGTQGKSARIGETVTDLNSGTGVADGAVPDCHVMHHAQWAHPALIFGRDQDGKARLRKSAPGILQHIAVH